MTFNNGTVNQETAQLPIYVNGKETPTIFDVLDTGSRDFVLGIPWLRRWSPRIDWKTGHLQWDEAREERPGSGLSESPQLHGTVAREGRTQSALPERPQLYGIAAHENEREGPEDGLSGRAGLLGVVVLSDNADELDAIPPQYRKYRKFFQEELETGLPAHSQFDHYVPLKEGQHPKFHRIYPLNRVQEAALEEYLEENLRKGYIRPSTSPRGIPDPIRTKEGRTTTTLCRLQTAQRHYNQESIPSAVDFGTTRQTTRSPDLHDARFKGSIQSDPNSRRGRVEDRFSNKAGTLRIPGHAFRTYQCTGQLPSHDQPCPSELSRSVRSSLSGRHLVLFGNARRA